MSDWYSTEVKRLTAKYGEVPPPWTVYNEHPFSMCWRMGGGETHIMAWRRWWKEQTFSEGERLNYFRRWPPPHCWLVFLIEATWDVEVPDPVAENDSADEYFRRCEVLGFGSKSEYLEDLDDPKWLDT